MWDEMAEIASKHLQPNDVIYVSGKLESYTKAFEDGEIGTQFQVIITFHSEYNQTEKILFDHLIFF